MLGLYEKAFDAALKLVESGRAPDAVARAGIRSLLAERAREPYRAAAVSRVPIPLPHLKTSPASGEEYLERLQAFVDELKGMPVAIQTTAANEQHYGGCEGRAAADAAPPGRGSTAARPSPCHAAEVPTGYFLAALGPRLKYSSCLYASSSTALAEAEEAMLELCCERAELADGQQAGGSVGCTASVEGAVQGRGAGDVLELGCGWGSWALFNAAKYPKSRFAAVSNSRTQKDFIDGQAKWAGVGWGAGFDPGWKAEFDRVISVEMLEHMKNYKVLFGRIARREGRKRPARLAAAALPPAPFCPCAAPPPRPLPPPCRRRRRWLKPQGRFFCHIFQHNRGLPYHYEDRGPSDWMTRHFFSGGTMPSRELLHYFQDDLSLQRQWYVNGLHYSRTLLHWLARQDAAKAQLWPLFVATYGEESAGVWWQRWRLFYLACNRRPTNLRHATEAACSAMSTDEDLWGDFLADSQEEVGPSNGQGKQQQRQEREKGEQEWDIEEDSDVCLLPPEKRQKLERQARRHGDSGSGGRASRQQQQQRPQRGATGAGSDSDGDVQLVEEQAAGPAARTRGAAAAGASGAARSRAPLDPQAAARLSQWRQELRAAAAAAEALDDDDDLGSQSQDTSPLEAPPMAGAGAAAAPQQGQQQGQADHRGGGGVGADDNRIVLKLQSSKGVRLMRMARTDPFSKLMRNYMELAEKEGHVAPGAHARFLFDGDELGPGDTPEGLDLEGDEIIEVHL
eukprot:scaffold2.g7144.t1